MYYNGSLPIEFFRRAGGRTRKLGILPGAFNPPTRAHLALARAGLSAVDEVLFVLPRSFPHKEYEGASFDERLRMLLDCTAGEPCYSVGSAAGGLYIDIVRECRESYPAGTELAALCGRDAAERIVGWDYGDAGAFAKMLEEFELLVASRDGHYDPPPELRGRIRSISMDEGCDEISATEVRERIRRGEHWRHLVPEAIAERVGQVYSE